MRLTKDAIRAVVRQSLAEDASYEDVTTQAFIPEKTRVRGHILAKESGVICGMPIARETFRVFDPGVSFRVRRKDGDEVRRGEVVAVVEGRARSILSCERVALNFLSYLSGVATMTRQAVSAVRGTGIRILDTRKTTPLLRLFEKYAVSVGGGQNHRFDLSAQYLVKDNHLFILKEAADYMRLGRRDPSVPFEIEVEDIRQLEKALGLCPDIVLLDNFSPAGVRRAVAFLRRLFAQRSRRPLVELSGGINLSNIRRYAIKGVDFISLGALTHSARALDLSLELVACRTSN